MKKERSMIEKALFGIFYVVILLGIVSLAVDIAHYSNTAVAILFLAAVVFLYGKTQDIINQEHSYEKFEKESNLKTSLYNAYCFSEYTGECISNVELFDSSTVIITIYDSFGIKINIDCFLKLKNTEDYDNLDNHISRYINQMQSNLPPSAIITALEISVKDYLNKI